MTRVAERPYLALLGALGDAGVRYAIGGGLAVVLHGVPRMTFDLDLIVDLADDNMTRLVEVLDAEGYRPRLPVPLAALGDAVARRDWVETRNVIAFTLFHPTRTMEEVDVLLSPGVDWSEVAASLVQRSVDGRSVNIVGRSLLKKMKLATGRDKDLADVEALGDSDA
jgi:hypothetical protein